MNLPSHNPSVDALAGQTSTASTPPRATRSAWLAVASIVVGTFAMVSTEFMPIGLLTDIAAGLHVSDGTAGLMVTMPGILAAIAGPALIVASGRLDRRTVLIALTALMIASNLMAALAPNFGTMLIARLVLGLCVGGFWTFAPTAATQLVPPASQARAMSYVLAGVSAATVLGVPAGSLLGTLFGWRATFGVTAVLVAAVLLVQLWLLPPIPPVRAINARDLLAPVTRRMGLVGLLAVWFVIAGHFSAYTYLKPLLQQVFGLAPNAVSTLLLVYGAVGFLGTFLGGLVVARSVRATMLLAALTLAAALLLSTVVGSGFVPGALVVVIWGVAFGLVPVAFTGWMMDAVPDVPEAGQALLVTSFQVATASGALIGGLMIDRHGISSAMVLSGSLVLTAVLIVAVFGRARRDDRLAAFL